MTKPTTPNLHITPMGAESTAIDGLQIITMKQVKEDRGAVREFFRPSSFNDRGLAGSWRQMNIIENHQGVIRGLHADGIQKLVGVIHGEAFGVYVDVRPESPTKGRVVTAKLTKGVQVLIPAGVGNGLQSVSEGLSQSLFCFDAELTPATSGRSVNPLDPNLGIKWPIAVDPSDRSLLSEKDANAPMLEQVMSQAS